MNKQDTWVIGGAVLFTILAGVWVHFIVGAGNYETAVAVSLIDDILDYFTLVAAAVTFALVYKARSAYGGHLSRSLGVIGLGLLFFMPTYWLSYRWNIEGSPAWLGMTTGFWSLLFNMLTLVTFAFIGYGFYLIWRLGKE